MTVLGAALSLLLASATLASAEAVSGQVSSISVTRCYGFPVDCEGYVTLWNGSTRRVVHVDGDTQIFRVGKPVKLGELGVGNLATFVDDDLAGPVARPRTQAP
jgi:hypothetical protein